jgi:CBS domain-containing protein
VRTDLAVGIGGHARTGGEDIMDEARVVDPYGLIQDVMSSPAHTLTPGLELDDPVVRTSLERHHGLPVVSADTGQVVGVLSRADVRRLGETNTSAYTVGEAMSAPPICVRPRAHIAEAAGVMLQHKVHRLPVVDDRSVPVGVATRQDVFEPLVATRDDVLADQQTRRYERLITTDDASGPIAAASDNDDRSSGVSRGLGGEKKHRASPLPRKNASEKKRHRRDAFASRRNRSRVRTRSAATRR